MSWARRIGLAAALLLLVGGAIAFAGGALGPGDGGSGARPSGPPLPAPTLLTPTQTLTRAARIDLTLTRPTGLADDVDYVVRLYVNDELERERSLPRQEQFVFPDVPLIEGENEIRAALASDDLEGASSVALTIVRDSTAPVIRVTRPEPNSTVYSDSETMRGRTEAGATLTVTDGRTGQEFETSIDADGRFDTALTLVLGPTSLTLFSRDPAGNEASAHITITRTESLASMTLVVSAGQLKASELPQRLGATAIIQDERGRPVDGAEVTFSLSPPNATTMTYRTTSTGGRARWPSLEIKSVDSPVGTWLVTVLAVLPSGAELRDDESVIVR
ncbi:MAG: Ig-like domain-containing protein [Chloroflexota bacterium]